MPGENFRLFQNNFIRYLNEILYSRTLGRIPCNDFRIFQLERSNEGLEKFAQEPVWNCVGIIALQREISRLPYAKDITFQ